MRLTHGSSTSLCAWAAALLLLTVAAAPVDDLVIDDATVVYGPLSDATRGAEVDINEIYSNHPAYMRMKDLGLDSSDTRGKSLLADAMRGVKSALAEVAESEDLDVITHLGGVSGGEIDIRDQTQPVINLLPVYYIDGSVWSGKLKRRAKSGVAEMDREAVLEAIPAYRDWMNLDPGDAHYHLLKDEWDKVYQKALDKVIRDEELNVVAQEGSVTSRLEPAPVITDMVIEALDP
jgi:hypothetical protein